MIDPEVQSLRKVAEETPDHLPVLFSIYNKVVADDVAEGNEYAPLTEEEWDTVYKEFGLDAEDTLTFMWEAFENSVLDVIYARETK